MTRTIILIPAHNEAASIAGVIDEIRRHCDFPVIVIDDASKDDTMTLARNAGAETLSLVTHLGAWGAIQTGIRYALQHDYELVITMDADGQHEASYLDDLVKPVLENQADIGIGAYPSRGSTSRKLAWTLLKQFSGIRMDDITSGFRAYNRKAMDILEKKGATLLEYQDIGVLALLCHHGLRIIEVPVTMRSRSNGHSRVYRSWRMVAYYMAYSLILGTSKRCLLRTIDADLPTRDTTS